MSEEKKAAREFDPKDAIKEFNKYEKGLFCVDSFIRAARWQFEQDKIAYAELQKQRDELKAQLESAREIVLKLTNESRALLAAHGDVISQDYGNTNMECLELRIESAREWLEKNGGNVADKDCLCGETNARNCPVHQRQASDSSGSGLED